MINKINCICGIDPGLTGGIVTFDYMEDKQDYNINGYDIPLIGKELDVLNLYKIFNNFYDKFPHIFLEDVHSIYGASAASNYTFGWVNGILEGIIVALNIPYTKVKAKEWQKVIFQGIPPIYKPSKAKGKGSLETKKMAILACNRLYPNIDIYGFTPTGKKSTKVKDGFIDALLIAEYGRRQING